jgi:hypothetical protein
MLAFSGTALVMMTCAFLPNGGMTTASGPDGCATGVAVATGPLPGWNAGGGVEPQPATATAARTSNPSAALMPPTSARTGGARR